MANTELEGLYVMNSPANMTTRLHGQIIWTEVGRRTRRSCSTKIEHNPTADDTETCAKHRGAQERKPIREGGDCEQV